MLHDARGLAMTTDSATAAARYDEAVDDYLDYRMIAGQRAKAALEADPDFVLGQCFRSALILMLETSAVAPRIQKTVTGLEPHLGRLTARERGHVQALGAWAAGDFRRAAAAWDAILYAEPHDLVALKLHHYLTFWTGRSRALRGAVECVLDAWDESVPGYSHVLGMYAFALEECGEYPAAEAHARRSIEMNGDDLWAIHALAHVLEMQGRAEEGLALLDRPLADWADRNPFQGHVWWHALLFLLALGDEDRALEFYDERLTVANTEHFVDIQNLASALKRFELAGIDVGDRWELLGEHAAGRVDDHFLAFNDVHLCLALAGSGRTQECARQLGSMREFASTPDNYTAAATAPVTLPVCEALVAHATGDYGRSCELLWPIRDDLAPMGGSHAQRDLLGQILADAAVRAGRRELAVGLLRERVAHKPSSRADWLAYAGVLDVLGDDSGAARARDRARSLPSG